MIQYSRGDKVLFQGEVWIYKCPAFRGSGIFAKEYGDAYAIMPISDVSPYIVENKRMKNLLEKYDD